MDITKKSNKIVIKLKSFSYNILRLYVSVFFLMIKTKQKKFYIQPIKTKKLTLLRSPHKYKKAQEHYHLKIYKMIIIIHDINLIEISNLLTNKPQGVYLNIKIKQNLK